MKRKLKIMVATALAALLFSAAVNATERRNVQRDFSEEDVTAQCDAFLTKEVYLGEPVMYTVTLRTNYSRILSIQRVDYPHTQNLSDIGSVSDYNYQLQSDGKGGYLVELTQSYYAPETTGAYNIGPGKYRITYGFVTVASDPFWGPYRTEQPYTIVVNVPAVKGKAKKLPSGAPENFSGAVGNFTFECKSPELTLRGTGEAEVSFTLEGNGLLDDITVPDIRSSFPENLRLKSITPQSEVVAQDDGSLLSRVVYKCRFTVKEAADCTIAPVEFCYFDTDSRKYVTVSSLPCEVTTKPKPKKPRPGEGQYVDNPVPQSFVKAITL